MPSNGTARHDPPRLVDEAQHRQHRDALAAARLADEPEHLAPCDGEVDTVDGVYVAGARAEPRAQAGTSSSGGAVSGGASLTVAGDLGGRPDASSIEVRRRCSPSGDRRASLIAGALRGSRASRSASPSRLNASTLRKIISPGKNTRCGALRMLR